MTESISEASQAYNLLWIAPRFVIPYAGGEFNQPIPDVTAENMLRTASINASADVRLWIDPRRLTKPQTSWVEEMVARSSGNMSLQSLRDIPEYRDNPLYNSSDDSSNWRKNKDSLIWRQVDAAKILVCLQGDYDQVFFTDADIIDFNIASEEVQRIISRHGIILRGWVNLATNDKPERVGFENQMFGFKPERRNFFHLLYERTLKAASYGQNGYNAYIDLIKSELETQLGIDTKEVFYRCEFDGTQARHPGEKPPHSFDTIFKDIMS